MSPIQEVLKAPASAARDQSQRGPRSKRIRRALIGLIAIAILGGGAWIAAQRALGPRVDAVRPTRRDVLQTVVSSGRVLAPAEVVLGGLVSGVVRAVHAREGERVRAGQLLLEYDDRELAALVAQARAGVLVASSRVGQVRGAAARVAGEAALQAQANLRAAQATLARQQQLFRSGAIAQSELEGAQRAFDVAQSQAQSAQVTAASSNSGGGDSRVAVAGRVQAEAALHLAEVRLSQTRVTAPADGVIMRRAVEPGDTVTLGRTLLVLLQDGVTELSVTPDERNLADLRMNQSALASAEAFPELHFPATVSYIAPTIDPLRGTVEVRLSVPSPPAYLRPAMTVSVEIEIGRSRGALTLPADAVRDTRTRAPWVLVVGPDGRTARRPVRVGLRGEDVVELLAGLREDERVVLASAGAVNAGRRVRPRLLTVGADAGRH